MGRLGRELASDQERWENRIKSKRLLKRLRTEQPHRGRKEPTPAVFNTAFAAENWWAMKPESVPAGATKF